MKRLLLVAVLVVFAGCTGVLPGDDGSTGPELDGDIGEVDNVSYDDDLAIDASDGLSAAELEPFLRRSMARVEVVRERAYEQPIDIEIITRSEYREQYGGQSPNETRAAWRNQLWEGLFIIGEDRDAVRVLDRTYNAAVQGFYDPGKERITIVSNEQEASINKVTLVHELVHALQDQRFGLGSYTTSWDEDQAYESVIEGEASVVPQLYLDRCDQWDCLRPGGDATAGRDADPGVLQVIRQPYEAGATFVEAIRDDGGWDAVDDLHENPPETTTEIIHPERYGEFEPANVTVADRSGSSWSRFDHDPVGERLGEASVFSMFAANGVIDADRTSYDHPASAGWAGDRFVPYRNGDAFGYVWKTEWQTTEDASQFQETYGRLLDEHGALARGADSEVIREGTFAGAYRVTRDGTTVTVVHGPTIESLSAVHSR